MTPVTGAGLDHWNESPSGMTVTGRAGMSVYGMTGE